MSRKAILLTVTLVLGIGQLVNGQVQVVVPGANGPVVSGGVQILPYPQPQPRPYPVPQPQPQPVPQPQPQPVYRPQPQFIPPSHGQYPVYVTPNEVVGVNPQTGGIDTRNRQIDNTAYQYGRNESQNNGTKRWVRRPIHNQQGQVIGYQQGWVWTNSFTGQEHGELTNYTPNGLGGVNGGHQSMSVQPGGVHENKQSYSPAPPQNGQPQAGGVHENIQSYSVQRTPQAGGAKQINTAPTPSAGGVHKNYQSFSVGGK